MVVRRQPLDLSRLHEFKIVATDGETTGLHWYKDKLFGVAVAAWDGKDIYSDYYDLREKPRVAEVLDRKLQYIPRVVNHNIKFDVHFLREAKIRIPVDAIECTSVRAALINEHEPSFGLDAMGLKYVGGGKVDIWEDLAKLFGGAPKRDVQIKNLHRAPVELAARYARPDPELAIRLWLWQEEEIKRQGLEQVWALERSLTPLLVEIEQNGVRVDEELAKKRLAEIRVNADKAQRALNKLAGKELNTASAPQMRALFKVEKRDDNRWYTDAGVLLDVTGKGNNASIDKFALEKLAERGDERAKHIQTLRKMNKAGQFLKDHIIGHALRGRVYPNYNQTRGENELGTGTGRFSIDDPAMQQIPARDKDIAAIVRACFLPEKGEQWACSDWEQFEFRWFAHYTNDAHILAAYEKNPDTDYHQIVSEITGIPRNPRYAGDANAKQINLGLVFGMGRGELADQMGMDFTVTTGKDKREYKRAGPKANEIFDAYHSAIPGVRQLLESASSIARSRGYVKTAMGRHIRFPGGKFVHKAAGLVFQGTSADCIKQKMVELRAWCKSSGVRMLLSVHDELDFSIPEKLAARAKSHLRETLECFDGERCPIKCRIPIRASIALGNNWWEACK